MRIHVDLGTAVAGSPQIIQADKTPDPNTGQAGATTVINGKYLIPLPPGIDLPLSTSSYVLNGSGELDGGDVTSAAFSQLLALYPQFGHIYLNPFLTSKNVDELNPTATFLDFGISPVPAFPCRYQSGRGGSTQKGVMPTHTALFPINTSTTPNRPGVMITNDVSLTSYIPVNETGFEVFSVYWRLQGFSTTQDILSNYGAFTGTHTNQAATRLVSEVGTPSPGLVKS